MVHVVAQVVGFLRSSIELHFGFCQSIECYRVTFLLVVFT